MKINKLTATFGKFNNESISFHGGLNIIEAPNESGKTTWCAFIMAMLYGVDSAERTKAGSLPVRQRYAPWSGAPMEGTAELTADNCDITIMRSTRLKNAPMREFSAFYTGTGIPVEKLSGSNAGELLTGVSRDVFARSAFVGQGAAALTGSPEMEKRIQAIFSTGEEETSYSEAMERLGGWQRKRVYRQHGLIPEIEAQIGELQKIVDTHQRIVFFGGAGVSTESGIPDFRSQDGLYHQQYAYPPETIISHSFFLQNTEEFYRFYKE